jgi:hypothetical protein
MMIRERGGKVIIRQPLPHLNNTVVKKLNSDKNKNYVENVDNFDLPETKNNINVLFENCTSLIYGEQKIGKTSLVSQFCDGNILFLSFEKGTLSQEVYSTRLITNWRQVLIILKKLEDKKIKEGELIYQSCCIDTGHAAYDRALEYVCVRDNIPHPGKVKDFGASWKEVLKEFASLHERLVSLGLGVIIISHDRIRDRETRDGETFSRWEPCFSESTELYYKAICDIVGFYHIVNDTRYLLIQPEEGLVAGHRVDGKFKTTEGKPVYRVPMGNSKEEAYKNLINAFDNKQVKQNKKSELINTIVKKKI